MLHKAWSSIEEVPYCFSRSSVKFQGHSAKKNRRFWPKLGVSQLKNQQFESNLSKITRPVAAMKSLRFALFQQQSLFRSNLARLNNGSTSVVVVQGHQFCLIQYGGHKTKSLHCEMKSLQVLSKQSTLRACYKCIHQLDLNSDSSVGCSRQFSRSQMFIKLAFDFGCDVILCLAQSCGW